MNRCSKTPTAVRCSIGARLSRVMAMEAMLLATEGWADVD